MRCYLLELPTAILLFFVGDEGERIQDEGRPVEDVRGPRRKSKLMKHETESINNDA